MCAQKLEQNWSGGCGETTALQRRWYTDLCTAGQAVELLPLHHTVVMLLMQKGQRSLNLHYKVPLLIFCLQCSLWIQDSVHWAIPARVILRGKYDWLIRCSHNWSFDISIFALRWNHLMGNSAFQHFVVDQIVIHKKNCGTAARTLTVSLKSLQIISYYREQSVLVYFNFLCKKLRGGCLGLSFTSIPYEIQYITRTLSAS